MAWLLDADITDSLFTGIALTTYLENADIELHVLAEKLGIRFAEDIGLQGDARGTVLVNGASQTGASLAVDGFTAAAGTLEATMRLRINGLRYTYEISQTATISGNAATLQIQPDLEYSPADNAAVSLFYLHPKVKQWLINWVGREICFEKQGKNNNELPQDDKYLIKYNLYRKRESKFKAEITKEMIYDAIDSIQDTVPNTGQLFRG